MAKFYPMFSGSDGNSTYIGDHQGGVLVDVGVSFKRLCVALATAEIPLDHIKAVLITHEHNDHIKGLKMLIKKHPVPVIASRDTVYALEFSGAIDYSHPRIYIDEVEEYVLDSMTIKRFPTSHDCKGSSCYTVTLQSGVRAAVCTDLGIMTDEIRQGLYGSSIIMLESNHDPTMLRLGPYPPELKLRISSDEGHLSNAVCAETLAEFFEGGTNRFVLGHLSKHNNTPEKAASATRAAIMDKGGAENRDYILYIAPDEGGKVIPI